MRDFFGIFIDGYRAIGKKARRNIKAYTIFLASLSALDGAALLLLSNLVEQSKGPIELPAQSAILLIVFLFSLKSALAVMGMWFGLREFSKLEVEIGQKNFEALMNASWIKQRDLTSNDFFNLVDRGPKELVVGTFLNTATLVSEVISITVLTIVIFVAQPLTALTMLVYFGIAALIQHKLLAESATNAGYMATKQQNSTYEALEDVSELGKLIRVTRPKSLEMHMTKERKQLAIARNQTWYYMSVPRYLLEVVLAFGFVVIAAVSFLVNGPESIFAAAGFFAVAGFRLLPSINRAQGLIFGIMSASTLSRIGLDGMKETLKPELNRRDLQSKSIIAYFKDVSFRYPDADVDNLTEVSFQIVRGKQYAIIGESGAGKTTILDLLLGLLEPTQGSIHFNKDNFRIGFVPQDTRIIRGTIYENVAVEWNQASINRKKVEECLAMVGLKDLLDQRFEPSRHTDIMGNISGGQKQRIGLARSLYKDPDLLVLDEATSALDGGTEYEIMREINSLRGKVAVVVVAHRLSTIRNVDSILYLEDGRASKLTSWDVLYKENLNFRTQVDRGKI
jgi:ABC-type multidrug transport system fused ATPase/permease subunit